MESGQQGFPPYWTVAIGLAILGPATFLSPIYLPVPVHQWNAVVVAGMGISAGAILAVVVGYVVDGVRLYRGKSP